MTWKTELQDWIKNQHGSAGWEQKLEAFIQDLLDQKAREIEGLIEKYQKSEEVTVNGQRFLIVGGLKKKFGYPFPDTKEKYLIREIKQALSILKEE